MTFSKSTIDLIFIFKNLPELQKKIDNAVAKSLYTMMLEGVDNALPVLSSVIVNTNAKKVIITCKLIHEGTGDVLMSDIKDISLNKYELDRLNNGKVF